MWRTVEYNQQQSKASKTHTQARQHGAADMSAHAADLDTTPPTASRVKRIVRDIRRAATALPRDHTTALPAALFPSVARFLTDAKRAVEAAAGCDDAGVSPVAESAPPLLTLMALGVGPFERHESRAGFLQMACFVALKTQCESLWRPTSASAAETSPSPSPPTKRAWRVEARFFEPFATPLHVACCEKLDVHVEGTNQFGRYAPTHPRHVVILFMPHCPWVLLHNTFAANWPLPPSTSATVDEAKQHGETDDSLTPLRPRQEDMAMQRVLWIANDLRETPLTPAATLTPPTQKQCGGQQGGRAEPKKKASAKTNKARRLCVYSEELLKCLTFTSIGSERAHSRRSKRGRTIDAESTTQQANDIAREPQVAIAEESSAVVDSGLSVLDIYEAFNTMAVMAVKPELSATAATALLHKYSAKPPAIIEFTMEL